VLKAFDIIARRRIEEAIERGELENLPGEGRPLDFSDEEHVPRDQRMAYRILKNSGFIPEGVSLRRRLAELERRVGASGDTRDRAVLLSQVSVLRARLERE
jgi:hypothetical protein